MDDFDFLDLIDLDNLCEMCSSELSEEGDCTWQECPNFKEKDKGDDDES